MINNIVASQPTHKVYPKLIEWTYKGEKNSVKVYDYDSYDTLLNKLVNAQVSKEPKVVKQIRYIRSKR